MFEKLEIVRMAQAMAAHAGARQAEISRNIANADTPGYRAQDLKPFGSVYESGPDGMRATRAGHLGQASQDGFETAERVVSGTATPNGNSVSLEAEMVKAVEVRQQHEMALAIYRNTSSILRSSLGRGR